jgi:hypothetical protein
MTFFAQTTAIKNTNFLQKIVEHRRKSTPGTDVMILKIFLPKKVSENNGVCCSNYCELLQKL